jgi:hypothetical protein
VREAVQRSKLSFEPDSGVAERVEFGVEFCLAFDESLKLALHTVSLGGGGGLHTPRRGPAVGCHAERNIEPRHCG